MTAVPASLPRSPVPAMPVSAWSAQSRAWPLLAIAVVLACQATMVFTRAINWDEFWFYYHVAEFTRDNLSAPLQSLHARAFAFLLDLPGSGVDHIVLARLAMLGCEVATLAAIYALALRFTGSLAALVAVLAYASAGYVFQHGFSFRTDPMLTATAMGALAVLARARLHVVTITAFSLLVGLATMISIKLVLLAPAFAGLAWLRWVEADRSLAMALRLVACGLSAVAGFALLFTVHSAGLAQPEAAGASAGGTLAGSLRWMFFLGLPPYWKMLVKGVMIAPLLVGLALWAAWLVGRSVRPSAEKVALAGLWVSLLLPFYYTNSAPYFYVFMLAPVAVVASVAAAALLERYTARKVALVALALTAALYATEDRTTIERQRQVLTVAAAAIPGPVAYFDLDGMLATNHKANDLLTPWGMAQYAERGTPAYREAMEEQPIPLVLANSDMLEAALQGADGPMLAADRAALQGNYLRYWGPLWVAGKTIAAPAERDEEFLIPGDYRVVSGFLAIDGRTYAKGAVITLPRGVHRVRGTATLRWAQAGPVPATRWDGGPIYVDF